MDVTIKQSPVDAMEASRQAFMAEMKRAGVQFGDGDVKKYHQHLEAAAARGSLYARAMYLKEMRNEGQVAQGQAQDASDDAYRANSAAWYTNGVGDTVTFGAHRSLQAYADKAAHGDVDGAMKELGKAGGKVLLAAGAQKAAAWGVKRAYTYLKGGAQTGSGTSTAARAGSHADDTVAAYNPPPARIAPPRPAPSAPAPPRAAPPPPPKPAAPVPPQAAPMPAPKPAAPPASAGPAAPPPPARPLPPTSQTDGLRLARSTADDLNQKVQRYEPTGNDPGAADFFQNMDKLRRQQWGGK